MNLGKESETIEFKKSTGEHKEAVQAIAAMLNKHGHGELYFGVGDNGEVTGQDVTDTTIRQVAAWISCKIEPTIAPTIEQLADENDKTFIRIGFSGAEAPHSADGRYFIRVGTSNNAMAASDLARMIIERDRARNPWDTLPSGRPISDADENAMRDFYTLASDAGRITTDFTNAADFLDKLGMVAADGTLTNAADVLFCNAKPSCTRMSLARLADNDKVEIIDLRHEGGPLLNLLKEATSYVLGAVSRRFVIHRNTTGDSRNPSRRCTRSDSQCARSPRLRQPGGRRNLHLLRHGSNFQSGSIPQRRLTRPAY